MIEKNPSLAKINRFNKDEIQNLDKNIISELVSELFNHIKSKESFNYISDLLIESLSEYKKNFPVKHFIENQDNSLNNNFYNLEFDLNNSKKEYLAISNDIHSILSNCPDLTITQKLDFCTNQRYFMKLYLKEVLIQINKVYPIIER
ncbi:MAG: hypothetical protein JSV23_04880 [Promethearchaeota archaeon]|nr:MAG: hypothetical protein JSV23_04880 [Candidatus Lokiarchaeota archaeon]